MVRCQLHGVRSQETGNCEFRNWDPTEGGESEGQFRIARSRSDGFRLGAVHPTIKLGGHRGPPHQSSRVINKFETLYSMPYALCPPQSAIRNTTSHISNLQS